MRNFVIIIFFFFWFYMCIKDIISHFLKNENFILYMNISDSSSMLLPFPCKGILASTEHPLSPNTGPWLCTAFQNIDLLTAAWANRKSGKCYILTSFWFFPRTMGRRERLFGWPLSVLCLPQAGQVCSEVIQSSMFNSGPYELYSCNSISTFKCLLQMWGVVSG